MLFLLGSDTLLALLQPLIVAICSNPSKHSDPRICSTSTLALTKFMIVRLAIAILWLCHIISYVLNSQFALNFYIHNYDVFVMFPCKHEDYMLVETQRVCLPSQFMQFLLHSGNHHQWKYMCILLFVNWLCVGCYLWKGPFEFIKLY